MRCIPQVKQNSYTFELTESQQELLLGVMLTGNFKKREVPYSLWSVEGDRFNATLYEKVRHGKRKLLVQGSGAEDFVLFTLEPQVLGAATLGYEKELNPERFSAHAGSDESGKGDYFGPLVVCCAYTDEQLSEQMIAMGVKDCKQMTDKAVLSVGAQLRQLLGSERYAVVKLGPAAYNRLYAKIGNINRMLAWAHGTAIEELLTKQRGCPRVVVDQFAPTEATIQRALKPLGKATKIEQRHKAESDIAVAAASVIARELFLRDIQKMSEEVFPQQENMLTDVHLSPSPETSTSSISSIPIGSSDPRVRGLAEEMVKKNGATWLMNHCKAHFQTTDKVLAACGLDRSQLPPEGQVVGSGSGKSKAGGEAVKAAK